MAEENLTDSLSENFEHLQITEADDKWISILDGKAEVITINSIEQLKRIYQQRDFELEPGEKEDGIKFAFKVIQEKGVATLLILTSTD